MVSPTKTPSQPAREPGDDRSRRTRPASWRRPARAQAARRWCLANPPDVPWRSWVARSTPSPPAGGLPRRRSCVLGAVRECRRNDLGDAQSWPPLGDVTLNIRRVRLPRVLAGRDATLADARRLPSATSSGNVRRSRSFARYVRTPRLRLRSRARTTAATLAPSPNATTAIDRLPLTPPSDPRRAADRTRRRAASCQAARRSARA